MGKWREELRKVARRSWAVVEVAGGVAESCEEVVGSGRGSGWREWAGQWRERVGGAVVRRS